MRQTTLHLNGEPKPLPESDFRFCQDPADRAIVEASHDPEEPLQYQGWGEKSAPTMNAVTTLTELTSKPPKRKREDLN